MPGCDSAGAAERSHPTPEARGGGQEKLSPALGQGRRPGGATHARGQGRRPGGATPHPRSGAAPAQEGLEELFHIQGQEEGGEEIPLVQGKEQRLCFARADTLRPR